MDVLLTLVSKMPCVTKPSTHEDKINCLENRILKLENDIASLCSRDVVDDRFDRAREHCDIQYEQITKNVELQLDVLKKENTMRLQNIDEKQQELKEVQKEIKHDIKSSDKILRSIASYLDVKRGTQMPFDRSSRDLTRSSYRGAWR
jgi:hypothetical protein